MEKEGLGNSLCFVLETGAFCMPTVLRLLSVAQLFRLLSNTWCKRSSASRILESRRGRVLVFVISKQKTQKELDSTLAVTWSLSCQKVGWRPHEKTCEKSSDHVSVDIVMFREF